MKVRNPLFLSLLLLLIGFSSRAWAQTNITVNASTSVVTIPSEIYGNNMAPWVGTNNGSDATYVTAMQVSGCRNIRWPGGSWADILNWNNIVCQGSFDIPTPQYITFLQKFGGQMHAICNFSGFWCNTQFTHTQAVSLATAWVTWNMTNTGSARAKYWDIGNENYGSWEQGGQGASGSTLNGTVYGQYFVDYYKAMKAVDPSILIGAVGSPGSGDYNSWTPKLLAAVKAAGVIPDYLIIHQYPGPSGTGSGVDASSLTNLNLPNSSKTSLDAMVSANLGSSYVGQVKYYNDEYNINNGLSILMNEYVNALFCSQWMLESAKSGWIGCNLWATKNGGSPDFGFINTSTDVPFPNYYVFPMLSGRFGNNMVNCSSSAATVRSYAATDASGNLTLFIVNNHPTNSMPANISVTGFTPASTGQAWVMLPSGSSPTGAPQEAPGLQINGNTNPSPANIASIVGTSQATGSTFSVNLQPNEMLLLVIPSSSTSGSTNTPIPTSTATRTNTPTLTFTQSPTKTNTATNTFTSTPTNTNTPTTAFTNTFTSTDTATHTSSNTPTFTYTSTNTFSSTVTNTLTVTSTPTDTFTGTVSPTNTPTHTLTPTQTFTFTNTQTNSSTSTPTSTQTFTPTNTSTSTNSATSTPNRTSTPTASSTPTQTSSFTSTPTATSTLTSTSTRAFTFTHTPTATNSATPTATSTPTFTPTSVTVSVITGPSAPSNSTQLPGAANVGVVQVRLNNPSGSPVTVTNLTLQNSGSPSTGITGITLLNNGTSLGTTTFSGTTAAFNGMNIVIPPGGSVTLLVNGNFSSTASNGATYQLQITGLAGTNGHPVNFTGMPYSGATVTIAKATLTPTPSSTITSTATPSRNGTPVIYPNPATGPTVNVLPPAYTGTKDVRVEIFTAAFRRVQDTTFANQPGGVAVTIKLTDRFGVPLANGLYYVVVIIDGHRSFAKLLVLN